MPALFQRLVRVWVEASLHWTTRSSLSPRSSSRRPWNRGYIGAWVFVGEGEGGGGGGGGGCVMCGMLYTVLLDPMSRYASLQTSWNAHKLGTSVTTATNMVQLLRENQFEFSWGFHTMLLCAVCVLLLCRRSCVLASV